MSTLEWRLPAERPDSTSCWHETTWLAGRHPKVARLVERVGAVDDDEEGRWVHPFLLKETVLGLDAYRADWEVYGDSHPWRGGPDDEAGYERWLEAGPHADSYGPFPGAVQAMAVMSRTEQSRLRLMATLGTGRVPFSALDLSGFDEEGQAFVRDWISLLI